MPLEGRLKALMHYKNIINDEKDFVQYFSCVIFFLCIPYYNYGLLCSAK